MPLNSSRYLAASNAVPFIGVVLHGYVQFAGTPINEEGDIKMAMLKAIENGASIYFTLAYQNTEEFKEDMLLNQYFSVRYDIWKEDLVDMYVELNNLLGDLQTKLIIDHEFLVGERVPDTDEVIADEEAKAEAERLEQLIAETEAAKQALKEALTTRHTPAESIAAIETVVSEAQDHFDRMTTYSDKFDSDNVKACAEIIEKMRTLDKKITEKQDAIYKAFVSENEKVLNDISTSVSGMLTIFINSGVDAIINGYDEPVKAELNAVKEAIIQTAVLEASSVALQMANGDLESNSDNFIDKIVSATSAKVDAIKAENATSEYSAAIATVADQILTNASTKLNANTMKSLLNTVKTTYNNAIKEQSKITTDYVSAVKALKAAIVDAFNAGVTKADVEAIIAGNTVATETAELSAVKAKYAVVKEKEATVSNIAKYSVIYAIANDEFNSAYVEGDYSHDVIFNYLGVDELLLSTDGILDQSLVDALNKLATLDVKEFEYVSYLNEIETSFEKLVGYRDEILAEVEKARNATDKIYATWLDYQVKAKESAEALIIYKTAFYAAEFNAEELEELKAELAASEEATESDKIACKNAIAIFGKTAEELEANYAAALEADKAQAKVLWDAAKILVQYENDAKLIEVELKTVAENKEVYDKKVISYEQFYNTAMSETATAESLMNEFETNYAKAEAQYSKKAILEAKVLLFSAENFENNEEIFESNIKDALKDDDKIEDMLSDVAKYIEIVLSEKEKINELVIKYNETSKAYDELVQKDFSAMSDSERAECLTAIINLSSEKLNYKNRLNESVANITTAKTRFQVPYALNKGIYSTLTEKMDALNKELDAVNALNDTLAADDPDKATVEAIKADYESRINALKSISDEFMQTFAELQNKAVENKLLDETGEISKDESYKDPVNNLFAVQIVVPEKYETTKYTCDDGSIVIVTYGGKDGDDDAAYRSFILNYNAFAVTVEYDGNKYVLDAYGYTIINY